MSKQLKEKLDKNIWITRKCRINASERLLKNAKFLEFINVYFSIFTILLSLFSLESSKLNSDTLSFVSLVVSVILTISIVYANSLGYRDRSAALKQNYIDLQLLLDQLAELDDNDSDALLAISEKYTKLLESVENHHEIDMLNLMRSNAVPNHSMTISDHWNWFFYSCRQFIFRSALVLAPVGYLIYLLLLPR